jgi:hypothetical protein
VSVSQNEILLQILIAQFWLACTPALLFNSPPQPINLMKNQVVRLKSGES